VSDTRILDWKQIMAELGPVFSSRATAYDDSDSFVAENYQALRGAHIFSALVPAELAGGGVSYTDVCNLVRGLGRVCGSTALALSMHQHILAGALWNYRHGRPGEKLLRRVAEGETILVSTGAADWLTSTGSLQRCEGGFRFTARKPFASGCLAGDLLITSGRYEDPAEGRQVLHFPVPMAAEGVSIDRVWKTMGMRGTGSHTVVLENVFVPEEAVTLRRPYGKYHPGLNVNLTIVLPLICSAYVGVAEAVAESTRADAARKGDDGVRSLLVGEMENELTVVQLALDSMVAAVNDLDVAPDLQSANAALIRKTIVCEGAKRVADKALEATAGDGYFRASGIERMARDLEAARFHTLQPKKQQRFTGRVSMGLDPVGD
jgi:alkylation response protein AidB-like acyl-CoA dehydrogenase